MSFLTLFAAGRSVVGMGDKNSPYRMRAANLLPKFESTKNPFAPKSPEMKNVVEQTPEFLPVASGKSLQENTAKANPAIMETASLFDTMAKPVAVLLPEDEPVKRPERVQVAKPVIEKAKTEVLPVAAKPLKSLPAAVPAQPKIALAPMKLFQPKVSRLSFQGLKKLNPLAYLAERHSQATPSARPKQVELSLEKVRVVRNHLNDADLEIKGAKEREKKFVLAAKLQPLAGGHAKTLDRLTTRFFGASSNQLQTHAQCQITTTIQ